MDFAADVPKKKKDSHTQQYKQTLLLLLTFLLGRLPLHVAWTIAFVLSHSDGVFAGHDVCLCVHIFIFSSTRGHVRTLVVAHTRER